MSVVRRENAPHHVASPKESKPKAPNFPRTEIKPPVEGDRKLLKKKREKRRGMGKYWGGIIDSGTRFVCTLRKVRRVVGGRHRLRKRKTKIFHSSRKNLSSSAIRGRGGMGTLWKCRARGTVDQGATEGEKGARSWGIRDIDLIRNPQVWGELL